MNIDDILPVLRGSVWHTTKPDRFESIINTGAIIPDPPLDDSERWGTRNGPRNYPYVRHIGGISLFDLRNFDQKEYDEKYPTVSYDYFIPYHRGWDVSVWIEINEGMLGGDFVDGESLLSRWKNEDYMGHKIMALIEAASLTPISVDSFGRVFIAEEGQPDIYYLEPPDYGTLIG